MLNEKKNRKIFLWTPIANQFAKASIQRVEKQNFKVYIFKSELHSKFFFAI